jgi:hypothetical protein
MWRRVHLSALAVVAALACGSSVLGDTTTWNYASDFSSTTNATSPGHWVSGYLDGTTVVPYSTYGTAYGGAVAYWIGSDWENQGLVTKNVSASPCDQDGIYWEPGQTVLRVGKTAGQGYDGHAAIARWTAPANGRYWLNGLFTSQDDDGSVQTRTITIVAGGSTLFTSDPFGGFYGSAAKGYSDRTAGANTYASYSSITSVSLTTGQTIDIIETSLDNASQHNTGIDFTVSLPEPCSIAMLLSGAIGLLAYAWRKRR